MTLKEAIADIRENGINGGNNGVVSTEALRIAEYFMEQHFNVMKGFAPVTDVYDFTSIKYDKLHVRTRCGFCNELLRVDMYPKDMWNDYMKDHYKPKLSKYCPECGYKVAVSEEDDQ